MNTFNVNFSSSPASNQPSLPSNTPPRRNVLFQQQEHASTTPAAPPPSQIFGSSQLAGTSKLQFDKGALPSSTTRQFQSSRTRMSTPGRPRSRLFQSSTQSNDSMEEDYTDDMEIPHEDEFLDDSQDEMEEQRNGHIQQQHSQGQTRFAATNGPFNEVSALSLMRFSTDSNKQSRMRPTRRPSSKQQKSQLPRRGREELIPGLAREVTRHAQTTSVNEPDAIILETEQICRQLEEVYHDAAQDGAQRIIVSGGAQELIHFWKRNSKPSQNFIDQGHIGPTPNASAFEKARFIATLLLELKHPQAQQIDIGKSVVLSDSRIRDDSIDTKPTPQVILEWLNDNHISYDYLFNQVITYSPNCTSSDIFWEALETLTLHGKFAEVGQILAEADFNYAVIDTPQGFAEAGYTGKQLQKIQSAIIKARQTFNACPAYQTGDWNVDGQEWDYFRNQVEEALTELATMSNEVDDDDNSTQNSADLFGTSMSSNNLPYNIFQHLQALYNILLGDANFIMGMCQDWLEASLMLTAWWNGADQTKVAQWSFDVSRAHHPTGEAAKLNPYHTRLRDSFLCVTDPSVDGSFHINTVSSVEIGIGAVLQGDIQSVLKILQTMSLCVASAVSEIGSWGGWYDSTATSGLDQEDLMVLNFGTENNIVKKDDILMTYALALFEHAPFRTADGILTEAWEVAFAVVTRIGDRDRIETAISDFISTLSIDNRERTEKLVTVCQQLGLQAQGRQVSETFGDYLVNSSAEFGTALLCYARAHSEDKVRQLVDLLNSYCLVQSKAYPSNKELDSALERLVSNPKEALQNIADVDPMAAETLQFYLVGYACIRRYFTLRDEGFSMQHGENDTRQLGKRKAASRALVSAINSAADSIYGGLYDPNRRSAIQVDSLLPLMGEATAFLARKDEPRILVSDQMYSMLAAIEDLQTVSDRVYHATEECMQAALRNHHGSIPPSPHAMLKKSISSGTNSNFSFSMMGSEMLSRSEESLGGKSLGSGVLVGKDARMPESELSRDWRASFKDPNASGADVLRVLRIGIAKELSIATIEENDVVL